jgi:hypothetical protein
MGPGVSWSAQSWGPLAVPEIIVRDIGGNTRMDGTVAAGGYSVEYITRACLPDEDMAAFSVEFGNINGQLVEPADLSGHWVRIDVIDDESFPSVTDTSWPSSGFKCVFAGYVYNSKVTMNPSASSNVVNGKKTYYCMGVLSRSRDWPMVYHGAFGGTAGTTAQKCYGNPGYNYPINGMFRSTIGNKSSSASYLEWGTDPTQGWKLHALPIDATSTAKWTDEETIKHALSSSRQDGEPIFTVDFSEASGLFSGTFAWPVNDGDTCFDHLRRVCSRSRGRGSVYADFVGTDSTPTCAIDLFLKARPSFSGKVTYVTKDDPTSLILGNPNTINGQTSGTDTSVDLVGDHRFFGSFEYEDRASAVFDYLEIVGERIQVVANLQLRDSVLQKGWTTTDETEFNETKNQQQRIVPRFRHVFRRFTLKQGWDFLGYVDTATPGTNYPNKGEFNVVCAESGGLYSNADDVSFTPNSSITSRLMADLPLYEGKRYDTLVSGYWSEASEYMPPPRMQPQLLYQQKEYGGQPTAEKRWVPLEQYGFNVQVDDFGVLIMHQAEESTGVRVMNYNGTFGGTPTEISGIVNETSGLNPEKMILVMGIELSNHVLMGGTVGPINAADPAAFEQGRRLTINVNGLHLWVGPKNAIWQVKPDNQSSGRGCEALRFSADADLTLIRDDRDALSFMFGLAKKYYGEVHNPGTWSLRDCGLKSYFSTSTGPLSYPALGRIVSSVSVSPTKRVPLDTPVTSIHYDHNEGITTWRTDYVNYQPGIQ